jgi:hypothetical protein
MRFKCANRISMRLRSRRDCSKASVSASARDGAVSARLSDRLALAARHSAENLFAQTIKAGLRYRF